MPGHAAAGGAAWTRWAAVLYDQKMGATDTWDVAFDHAYTVVSELQPYEELERRGFAIPQGQREHPGGVSCRVLLFPAAANERLGRSFQYLEFVKLSDVPGFCAAENAKRQKKGLAPRTTARIVAPGFSLLGRALRDRVADLQTDLAAYRPEYEHVNYRWQTEHASDAPGWSYLKFREDPLPIGEFWITEYDPDPIEVDRHRPTLAKSPNACHSIVGCLWDLGAPDDPLVQRAARLCGGVNHRGDLTLGESFTIWHAGAALPGLAPRGPFQAMVLACSSLDDFKRHASPDAVVRWNGQDAAILTPFPSGWAIVVIERPASGSP